MVRGRSGFVAVLAMAGCSSVSEMVTPNLLDGEAAKAPFFETASARIGSQASPTQGAPAGNPATPRLATGLSRAYSGQPDELTLKDIQKSAIIELPHVQQYMQKIVDELLRQWPYETGRIGVFTTSKPGFDAQANAAGDIVMTAGLLTQIDSEDELAAVLGHEVSHLLLRHHERSEAVADNKKLMNTAASVAVYYLMFSNTDWTKTAGGYHGTVNTGNWMTQSMQAGGACLAATYMVDKLIDPNWSRTQEDEADLLGLDLMIKAGYDPNAALTAMRRRVEYDGEQKTIVEQRRASGDYDKMVSESVEKGGIGGLFMGAAKSITAGVIDTFSDLDNYISQKHRMSEDRLKSMQLYLDRHYSSRDRKPLRTKEFAKIMRDKKVVRTFENYEAARQSAAAVMSNDLPKALELAKASLSPPTQNAIEPRFAMYTVQSAMGNEEEAFKNLTAVKNLDAAPPQFLRALAGGYAKRGNIAQAELMSARAIEKSKSVYDTEQKSDGSKLAALLTGQPQNGANRFDVSGFCEELRSTVSGVAGNIADRQL